MSSTIDVELTEAENELYDRQIRLWGLESQQRLRKARVLISGINGFGAEVTKNVILSGVHSVMLHDNNDVSEEDMCSQFLVSKNHVGVNRATASVNRARQLNPMVDISAEIEPLANKGQDFFTQFHVIIIIGALEKELIRIDNICCKMNIKLFCGDVWGTFGYCCAELQNHIYIEDVVKHKAISTVNQKVRMELTSTPTEKLAIFPPLQEIFNFDYNSDMYTNDIKRKRKSPAFVLLRILQKFREIFNRDPSCKFRDEDIAQLKLIRDKLTNENILPLHYFFSVFNQISPCAAVVGGVLAQEVVKVISKKEAPLKNIFLFDSEHSCGFIECFAF